jgi:hypothetical protein
MPHGITVRGQYNNYHSHSFYFVTINLGKSFLGIHFRTSIDGKNARKKRERQRQLEDIKDDDVKREIAKGNTLISYTEYQPQ